MLSFTAGKGNICIRAYVIPRNPDTAAQKEMRSTFADAVKSWQALTKEDKYRFSRKARGLNMSGYNLYLSGFIKEKISAGRKSISASGLKSYNETMSLLSQKNHSYRRRSIFHSVSYSKVKRLTNIDRFIRLQLSPG